MALDERIISKAIIERYSQKLLSQLDCDCVIVGGGPAGLICGYELAKNGLKVTLFDKRLSVGGGMWGGAMMFNEIVVQEDGKAILDEFDIKTVLYEPNYYTADSIEAISTLISKTVKAGVKIFNGIEIEDVVLKKVDGQYRVGGVVINWTTVNMAHLPVDPIVVSASFTVDATGHDAHLAQTLVRKAGVKLNTESGDVVGEKPMWADVGEQDTVNHTKEIYNGLYVCGMAANACSGAHRMGPIFGGMLNSGKKCASLILEKWGKK
ncbi:MAG: sulfide-dependent adenosine diphosphate thiazole synthase [Desulfurella sp.]|uniref:sulfide-dependent adenosine diphosphate thiazole synthase n=1 Tax=Desulfurella sp. TaxID=1962857 RepID=UPI003D14D66B